MLLLHAAGLASFLVAVFATVLGTPGDDVRRWLVAYGLGSLPLLMLALSSRSRRAALTRTGASMPARSRSPLRVVLPALLIWGALSRIVLLDTAPSLSDDVYRYVWEGRLVAGGVDPYDVAPSDWRLADRIPGAVEWARINHRDLPAIYPPIAQWGFGLIAAAAPSELAFRAAFVVCDLVVIALLAALLVRRGGDPRLAALYALHPLAAVEIASSGHYEPFALLPLLLGLFFAEAGQPFMASVLLGVSAGARYLAALPAAMLARNLALGAPIGASQPEGAGRRPQAALLASGLVALPLVVASWPFAEDGTWPIGSLPVFARDWGWNASVHAVLADWMGYHPARWTCGALFLVGSALIAARIREPVAATVSLLALLLYLSPVVHPWYALSLLCLLPLAPSFPLLLLVTLQPLSYLSRTMEHPDAGPPLWARLATWGLPALLLLLRPRRAP
jgi:hypothetical protein